MLFDLVSKEVEVLSINDRLGSGEEHANFFLFIFWNLDLDLDSFPTSLSHIHKEIADMLCYVMWTD